MKVKSPSKFTSLETLISIQNDNYIGKTGQEYVKEEVDSLIWKKQSENDENSAIKALKELDKFELYVIGRD